LMHVYGRLRFHPLKLLPAMVAASILRTPRER
jgi:hypothetical protein